MTKDINKKNTMSTATRKYNMRQRVPAFDMSAALEAIESGTETDIHYHFKKLCAFLNNDARRVSDWVFASGLELDIQGNKRHRYLVNATLEFVGLKDSNALSFMDKIPSGPWLSWIGVNRVNAKNGVHYRIRTGAAL